LGDALLDDVTHDHEQDEVEGGELGELLAAEAPGDGPQEEEDDGRADDHFHQGITRVR